MSRPNTIYLGDSLLVLPTLEANSFDACVTDPPYELGFMGKGWDRSGIANSPVLWREVFRVLRPGAHLVAFGGTRTYHRMVCGIEDAGFEIRDQLAWVFGSGFPKSSNQDGDWKGWGTALKPAWEPIVLARKPLIGTVPENLAEHRTGALNIDGCRIGYANDADREKAHENALGPVERSKTTKQIFEGGRKNGGFADTHSPAGRWPANLCHDGSPEVVACFPADAGAAAPVTLRNGDKFRNTYGAFAGNRDEQGSTFHGDTGSAARFYYCAKADRDDRDAGCDAFPLQEKAASDGAQAAQVDGDEYTGGSADIGLNKVHRVRNFHPTVKPTDLMRWLCRLVTPPGGRILDPFLGSGSTGRGAVLESFSFVGIEREAEYAPIALARIREAEGEMFASTTLVDRREGTA